MLQYTLNKNAKGPALTEPFAVCVRYTPILSNSIYLAIHNKNKCFNYG